ncbi:TRAP transporter small permease [Bacillus sp. B15-48]|uniref:TRAP transporter small permease n=1 Tax=Bacillus sp. B15-48 TaxID=1548601 RepID=UPI00193EC304|nr:TRAP transporter small permease [Bacillus sp. B15-48]MBM4761135.1 TRAP transporter small permease subunit [Bacillus sp. B15-48]
MKIVKLIKNKFDNMVDLVACTFIGVMTLIVTAQVFTRYLFNYTPRWSEELSLLLLIYVSMIGIAVGFRDKLHIGVGIFVGMMPKKAQTFFDYLAKLLVIFVSLIFIYYGIKFTSLMNHSTMAGTGLPSSVLYASIPISGFLMLLYGIELLFKRGMHQEWNEEVEE